MTIKMPNTMDITEKNFDCFPLALYFLAQSKHAKKIITWKAMKPNSVLPVSKPMRPSTSRTTAVIFFHNGCIVVVIDLSLSFRNYCMLFTQ